jgi:hypothetical protein
VQSTIADVFAKLTPIEVVGIVLGLIPLGFAFTHGINLSKALKRLDEINKGLTKSVKLLPTQPLYKFPKYVPTIAEHVGKAKDSIVICCDNPSYGSFSSPDAFLKYKLAILTKTSSYPRVPVTLYYLNEVKRHQVGILQFQRDAWPEFHKNRLNELRDYLAIHPHEHNVTAEKLGYDEFINLIVLEDTISLTSVFGSATTIELAEKPPVYFWLFDRSTMVFVIPGDPSMRLQETGFFTRDPHLINGILDLAERYTGKKFEHAGTREELAPPKETEDDPADGA